MKNGQILRSLCEECFELRLTFVVLIHSIEVKNIQGFHYNRQLDQCQLLKDFLKLTNECVTNMFRFLSLLWSLFLNLLTTFSGI